jgi:NADP-dependent 3-hydroxy acid dehydrogenase YdfG
VTGSRPLAVVTGASSGIGAATARALAAAGFEVVCAARRADRVEALACEIEGRAVACDVSSAEDVARLREAVGGRLDVLVNNAGGALGLAPAAETSVADWRGMYESNVIGTLQVTQALLPALIASGAGTIVNVGSIAGRTVYEGGSGYTAAKHAVAVLTETLRLELVDQPVRVEEVAPGMVHTEEFSLTRFGGDAERAAKVYDGVPDPLTADDVAETITWAITRPPHVNVDLLVVRPRAQASNTRVYRTS